MPGRCIVEHRRREEDDRNKLLAQIQYYSQCSLKVIPTPKLL